MAGNIVPPSNDTKSIGTPTKRWGNGYFKGLKVIDTIDGNAASATKATQDGNGKVIPDTYATKADPTFTGTATAENLKVTNVIQGTCENANYAKNGTPVGTIIDYAGSTAPDGYLVCDGSKISRTTYDNLFKAIGTIYGTGDGSTTFTLPNLVDRFKEGSSSVGTYKSAGLPNITGSFRYSDTSAIGAEFGTGAFSPTAVGEIRYPTFNGSSPDNANFTFDASRCSTIYSDNITTVQPNSCTVLPCIKY